MKSKKYFLLFFLLVVFNQLFSQEKEDKQQKFFLKANLIGLGIAAEYSFNKNFTIHCQVSNRLNPTIRSRGAWLSSKSIFFGGLRWYYNMNFRDKRNKYTNGFSANYFSIVTRQDLGPYIQVSTNKNFASAFGSHFKFSVFYYNYYIGLQHGFQRYFTKNKNWYVDFNIGMGIDKYYNWYLENYYYTPYSTLRIGFNGMLGVGLKIK
jgi:hypothetical protein